MRSSEMSAGSVCFMLAAFYLVAGAVRQDRGIGQILAATPMTKIGYLGAKLAAQRVADESIHVGIVFDDQHKGFALGLLY